uniref:Glycosyltransferase family 1 protein n=1 Tax=candidate division WWE3 bacterium TaxID=2053526 RepID=A0A7C4TLD5_UNCKA
MKVLMWGRYDLLSAGGGDKVQVESTANELRKLGIEVDISTTLSTNIESYDIIHVFQLDWMSETYFYAKKAKKFKKPFVLSPIHHNVAEVQRFDDEYAYGLRKLGSTFLRDQHNRDTLKNLYRSFKDRKKLPTTLASVFLGLKNMHIKTLQMSDMVLVQTELEAKDLKQTYHVDIEWKKVPNGVGGHFLVNSDIQNPLDIEDYILCVGRIEARKNQLSIIKAVEELIKEEEVDLNLVFIGKKSGNHGQYVKMFDAEVAKNNWITYLPEVPYSDIPPYFKYAKVCVSASWFETSGLTSLEALFMGTNVVASGDRAREFLRAMASYCDPGNIESIKNAISKELAAPRPKLNDSFKQEFTWKRSAELIKEVYTDLLKDVNS